MSIEERKRVPNWLISTLPIIVFITGLVISFIVYDTLKKDALRIWEENATRVSEWLSGTVMGWMEESYAPVSAISMLQDSKIELTEDDFYIAYDALEARASAFFIDVIAIMEFKYGRWILKNTTDNFSPLNDELIITPQSDGVFSDTLKAADARKGRIVIGNSFNGPTGHLKSPLVLVTDTQHGTFATIGLLNYDSLLDGLFDVHAPFGIGISLSARFPNETARGDINAITGRPVENLLFTNTTRTISGEAEFLINWSFDDTFEGGPKIEFAEATLWFGILISILLSLILAFLAKQNKLIKMRVDQATRELSKSSELIKEREERVSLALKGGNLGFWDVNLETNLTVFNKRYAEIFGYDSSRREGLRDEWINQIHPEDLDLVLKHGQAFRLGNEEEYEAEYRIIRDDGEMRWVISKGTSVKKDANGIISRMVGTVQDITIRKEAENRIASSEERSRLLLHSVGEGVFGVDTNGIITFVNPECKAQLGFSEDELLGTKAHSLFHHTHKDGRHYPVEECWMYKSFTEGNSYRIDDEVLWRKDGSPIAVEYNSTPIVRDDEVVGAVISFNDISERLVAQKERDEALSVISSSIQYSSQIQRSILPQDEIDPHIIRELSVIWEPRDLVGGDIYWKRKWGSGTLLILADCTGHGVPGAFMTLIATGALDRAQESIVPGEVGYLIQTMHQLIQKTLGQDLAGGISDDGLELGACYLSGHSNTMIFSGARFDLFVANSDSVEMIKGTKSGIGYRGIASDQHFRDIKVQLETDKNYYMASDGIWDQVGGPRGRAFGKKRFRELLQQIANLSLAEQSDEIKKTLIEYQGEQRRRDDVSCLSFRVPDQDMQADYSI